MQRDGDTKIYGPYEYFNQFRVHVVTRRGGKRTTLYQTFATRDLADAFIAGARDEAQGVTVKQSVDRFLDWKRERELANSSVESAEDRLAMILGPLMQRPVRAVLGRGAELYVQARVYPKGHRREGKPRAADTHQNALAVAKDWGAWCVKQRMFRANPFAEVEAVGRKVEGADKPRLTVDESRQLQAHCHKHAATDPGAVITLAYLLLGSRASELVKRDVRDLDDHGRLLWIGRTKTGAGTRRLLIPDELTPYLVAIADGRPGDAPLFVSEASRRWPAGRRWSRHMAYNHVRRIAADAKVPVLPPQALRRTQATLAEDAGETALAVARHLGHATAAAPAVTHRSYVGRDTVRNAAVKRGLAALRGGRDTGNAETTAETGRGKLAVGVLITRRDEALNVPQ